MLKSVKHQSKHKKRKKKTTKTEQKLRTHITVKDNQFITACDAQEISDARKQITDKAYRNIMDTISQQIRIATSVHYNSDIIFKIPLFVTYMPAYNLDYMQARIVSRLRKNGFYIKIIKRGTMFISWKYMAKLETSK